jgi:hypothetical protein
MPPQYNDFLFATIGEQRNETPLSVLSALTRLDIDPWQEAARLSELPKDQAAQIMRSALAALPGGRWTASESSTIAARLVELLPQRKAGADENVGRQIALSLMLIWLIFAALWGAFELETRTPGMSSAHHADMQVNRAVASRQLPSPPSH